MKNQVANVSLMQKMNRLKVLHCIRENPDSTRIQLSEKTGLSLPSITNITAYLLEKELICENGAEQVSRVGRKSSFIKLRGDKYNLICVCVYEKSILISKCDLTGKETVRHSLITKDKEFDEIIENLCDNLKEIILESKEKTLGIGVAVSGLVLSQSRFVMSTRLKWKETNLKKSLEEKLNTPVFINNISVIKAVGYFSLPDTEKKDSIYVDMENGIGAVQYSKGTVQKSVLGEIGHTTLQSDGPLCFCGNRGCLETLCSPERLLYLYNQHGLSKAYSVEEIEKLYKSGDEGANFAVNECGKYLGMGLANLVNLFSPSQLILNTGDFSLCPSLVAYAEKEMKSRAFGAITENMSVIKTGETEDIAVKGIAFDLFDKLFDISFEDNIVD